MLTCNKPLWWKHSSQTWFEIDNYFNDSINNPNEDHYKEKNWRSISLGRSNNSYRFSKDNEKYFIQITNRSNNQFLPYERSINLKNVMSTDAYKQFSNWLVETLYQSEEVKIQHWFESKPLDLSINKNTNIIKLLASFLADLHQITPINLPAFNLKAHLLKYQNIAHKMVKNKDKKNDITQCLEKAILTLNNYQNNKLCHYDLNLNNILFNGTDIKIVDWEYVCIGDPVLDITALVENFKLSQKQENYFLSHYHNNTKNNSQIPLHFSDQKMCEMKVLNQCIYKLWEYGQ